MFISHSHFASALAAAEFAEDIRLKRMPVPGLKEAIAALAVVEQIYGQRA